MNYGCLKTENRAIGYTRASLRQDVLYNYFRFRDLSLSASKKTHTLTRVQDLFLEKLVQLKLISPEQKNSCLQTIEKRLYHIEEFDDIPVEQLYYIVHMLRMEILGKDVVSDIEASLTATAPDFIVNGIDQSAQKQQLIDRCDTLLLILTDWRLWKQFRLDLDKLHKKQIYVIDTGLISRKLLPEALLAPQDLTIDPDKTGILFYGEEGLCCCHGLRVDSVVHCTTDSYFVQALTGLWEEQNCLVYVPKELDMLRYVPLTSKTRLNYSILWRLWQGYGEKIYSMSIEQLYKNYPKYFVNVYSGYATNLPLHPQADTLQEYDRQTDEAIMQYLSKFSNAQFISAYFDEDLEYAPICYSGQSQSGILVQAVKVQKAVGAQVLSCPRGQNLRQMFKTADLPGTALVSNFLFFMTPKLGLLYNDLRKNRPQEQADAASGHLDYMRCGNTETFPLFRKACVAMKEDGQFLFFNYQLGGGSISVSGINYRWEKTSVNNDCAGLRVYTPFYSAKDIDADRDTYTIGVGAGRVNMVLIRNKVTCIRKGDVLLPSVGIVISLPEKEAAPLLQICTPLSNGYYDTADLTAEVSLDPPEEIDHQDWAQVIWAYGGGLTLIQNGIGLCDNGNMQQWFENEGWTTPLSRQTQEANLHSLIKHPRTAIGCTADGSLVMLVFSGRTWRSTGADYSEMITIARRLFPDIRYLMNCDGGGSAMLGMVADGEFMELSFPSTSSGSCAGQVRPINTVLYIPLQSEQGEKI